MTILVDNWGVILILILAIVGVVELVIFKDKKKAKEWLLLAVLEAEKLYGSKTGAVKLRYVYDMFLTTFPILSKKSFGKHSPAKVVSSSFVPIGSGPYAIESYNEISDLTIISRLISTVAFYNKTVVNECFVNSEEIIMKMCELSLLKFEEMGKTPVAYITELRMERAKNLLSQEPPLTVEQIAELCGFSDSFYFSKTFKKHTGLSPLGYRKGHRS